ncbi:MAG: hypothetical protein LPK38_00990, partial [Actinomycetes bacterium]|nr:hypothetical protein [Actinomycetes bacterium]MDX5449595.1 hypothetical protein [Actinomycetes bacterium]
MTTAAASTADVEFTPSDAWDEFWDAIDASGYGIRLTEADGVTPLTYAWSGFNATNKTGTIQIDAAPTPVSADRCVLYWLYFDTDTPTDGSSAVTIASPLTAYLDVARPDPSKTFAVRAQEPGATVPRDRFAKSTDDSLFIWLDFGEIVLRVEKPYNGRLQWEEPAVAQVSVLDSTGAAVASMTDASEMRWVSVREQTRDRLYLRIRVKAGTDQANYTVVGEILSSTPDESPYRTLHTQVGVNVRDVLSDGAVVLAPLGTSGWANYQDTTHTS